MNQIKHYCPVNGNLKPLDGRYLDEANEQTGVCPECENREYAALDGVTHD